MEAIEITASFGRCLVHSARISLEAGQAGLWMDWMNSGGLQRMRRCLVVERGMAAWKGVYGPNYCSALRAPLAI